MTNKTVDAIIDLQWGSCGKGKIVSTLASHYDASIRTGAPQAGHTIKLQQNSYIMRSVPCAWINPTCKLYVGPAGLINLEVLEKELEQFPISANVIDRLRFDNNATIVTKDDIEEEIRVKMNAKNGSTAEGVGPAIARKVLRRDCKTLNQMQDLPNYIKSRLCDTAVEANNIIDHGGSILLEGTQGTGLSLNHAQYPFVTSRDILSASLFSDAGLAPATHRHTFGVMRSYPIRVAGHSGDFGNAKELSWEEITARCGAPVGSIVEKTTVTKRVRRVAEIDWDFMRRSVALNRPGGIFVTFIDYISWVAHGVRSYEALPGLAKDFVKKVESELNVPVVGVSTGPAQDEMVWMPSFVDVAPELAQGQLSLV